MQDRLFWWRLGLVLALLVLGPASLAQTTPTLTDLMDGRLLQQMQRQAPPTAAAGLTLEGAIDPAEYIVGPGDQFTLSVGGAQAQDYYATISADGYLIFAEVGRFRVAGETLAAVQEQLQGPIRRIYRNVTAELVLTQPRQFFVHVSGAVMTPGRHLVGPVARVEDAVRAAMDDENPLRVIRQLERARNLHGELPAYPALRNIRVFRTDGTVSTVDLRLYYATGNREENPYLRDGDVVVVPAFDPYSEAVFVDGSPLGLGLYDFRPGDTVATLLALATGLEDSTPTAPVRLVRADGQSHDLTPGASTVASEQLLTPIQPGDRLVISPTSPDRGTVAVEGRVLFPGNYPIEVGKTTIGEVLAMAGGLRADALANAAYVERRGAARPRVAGLDENRPQRGNGIGATADGPGISPIEVELLLQEEAFRSLRLADLDFASRQYLLNELRRTPRAPVDLRGNPHAPDLYVTLHDGDRLVIPGDPGGIYVFGQVVRSVFVPYEAELTVEDYVRRAGGRTAAATDAYVRRAGSGHVTPVVGTERIEPGDAIFIDRRLTADTEAAQQLALQERQVRAQNRQQWVQMGAAVIGSATAIITALILSR